jgi:hypothetical protein
VRQEPDSNTPQVNSQSLFGGEGTSSAGTAASRNPDPRLLNNVAVVIITVKR